MAKVIDINSHGNSERVADKYISQSPVDRVVEIERLAALDSVDYETARNGAAERLGFRASVLDQEVKKKRRELGLEGWGRHRTGQGRNNLGHSAVDGPG